MASYTLGLDLASAADWSAIAIVERLRLAKADPLARPVERRDVVHLERFRRGTPYTVQVQRVEELLADPELAECALVLDATGVGRGVLDMFYQAKRDGRLPRWPVGITITAGEAAHGLNIPKKDLVSGLVAAFEQRRLRIAPELALAEALERELLNFQAKLSARGGARFEAATEATHDDLVLALALAHYWRGPGEPRYVARDGMAYATREHSMDPY